MNLLINPVLLLAAGLIILSAAVIFGVIDYQNDLDKFRANLRPGDMVRVKTSNGIVRARIMKRNGSNSFYSMCIDSRQPILTPLKNILRP